MSTEENETNVEHPHQPSSSPPAHPCSCGSGKPRRANNHGRLLDVCDVCFERRVKELAQKFRAGLPDPKEG